MTIRSKFSLYTFFMSAYVLLAVVLAWINYFYLGSPSLIFQISLNIMLATSLICMIGMVITANKAGKNRRLISTGWIVLLIAFLFDVAGNVVVLFFPVLTELQVNSFFYLISYSLVAIGILLIPFVPRPQKPHQRQHIDLIVFVLVSIVAVWALIIFPNIFRQMSSLDQAYSAVDYLMVFAVLDFMLRRKSIRFHKTSILFALGVGTIVLGHILLLGERNDFNIWVNFLMFFAWLLSDAAFCLAAVGLEFENIHQELVDLQEDNTGFEIRNDFLLPIFWVSLVYGILVWTHYNPNTVSFPVLAIGTGSLIILLIIRLMNALKENARLIAAAREEIRSRKSLQEKLWHDIRHDSLTALPNRSYLVDQLQTAMDTTREANKVSCALFFLDLDRFKEINDNFGHSSGDILLKAVAERLIFCVRPDDFVTRLGGDEFAILLNNLQNSQIVHKVADRIMEKMKEPFEIEGKIIKSGVSFGIAYIHSGFNSPEEIIKEADKAMYRAKKNGRGCFEISGDLEY